MSTPTCRAACRSAISVGSPLAPCSPSSALLQLLTTAAIASTVQSTELPRPAPAARSYEPAAVQIVVTCMSFWVSVPVLSVQITVVEPSVSTAERRFTIALRLARSRTPIASARVMVGSRPSGTFAYDQPDGEAGPGRRPAGSPASTPACRNTTPVAVANTAIM